MKVCEYHPLSGASYHCAECAVSLCETCCDEQHPHVMHCFVCHQPLQAVPANNGAEPFWRRFDKAFRYGLSRQALILVGGVSLVTTFAGFLPFSLLWYLLAFGALMKYSFSCLQATANGQMTPPDIATAFGGGLSLLLRLLGIVIATLLSVALAFSLLGPVIGGIVGIVAVAALPASLIIFAMTDRIGDAVNPLGALQLMSTVGLPYGLLLAILLVMSGSVQVISELFGANLSWLALSLNSMVSNYYTVVTFHLMGYMLFQYQDELDYVSPALRERPLPREQDEWCIAKAQVLLKAGEIDKAAGLLSDACQKHPGSEKLHEHCFEFLLATSHPAKPSRGECLRSFADRYLSLLLRRKLHFKLAPSYLRIRQRLPDFVPATPSVRHALAQACEKAGEARLALNLLNGLHRQFPDYKALIPAYELMAQLLDRQPATRPQAEKCRALLKKLQQHTLPV